MVTQNYRLSHDVMRGLQRATNEGTYVPNLSFSIQDDETVRLMPAASFLVSESDGRPGRVDTSALDTDNYFDICDPKPVRAHGGIIIVFSNVGGQEHKVFDPFAHPAAANTLHHSLLATKRVIALARQQHAPSIASTFASA
jgi:hypothetical protein